MKKFKFTKEVGIFAALLVLMSIFTILNPMYMSPKNLLDIVDQAVINGLLALGMTLVIITGGIDLSVGSTMAIVIVVVSKMLTANFSIYLSILVGIIVGYILGFINGFLVSNMKLQPFIATMGTSSIYRGIAYLITKGWPILGIPSKFRMIFDGKLLLNISNSIIIFAVIALVLSKVLKSTKFGTYIYSIGNNEEATKLSGVDVDKYKRMTYSIAGVCAALAGMVMLAKLGTGDPTAGQGYETNAIAAAAIGGTSLAGGIGSILGTFLGTVLLQALKVGLVVLGVDTFWQFIATGTIIIIAVFLDIIKDKIKLKRNKK